MSLPKLITWTERVKNSYWQEAEQLALRRSAAEELGGTNHDWNRFSDNFVSRVFHLLTSKGARYEKAKDPGNEVDSARGQRWTWTPEDQISSPALPPKALYKIRAALYFLWASVLTPVVLWVDVTIQWMNLWVWEIDGVLSVTWHYLAFFTNLSFYDSGWGTIDIGEWFLDIQGVDCSERVMSQSNDSEGNLPPPQKKRTASNKKTVCDDKLVTEVIGLIWGHFESPFPVARQPSLHHFVTKWLVVSSQDKRKTSLNIYLQLTKNKAAIPSKLFIITVVPNKASYGLFLSSNSLLLLTVTEIWGKKCIHGATGISKWEFLTTFKF